MMKRLLILVIAVFMAVSLFSCSSGKKNPAASSENTTLSTESTDITNDYNPNLEAIDGHGKVIKVLTRESAITANYWYEEMDSEKGDRNNIVDSKVFTRNSLIEDKYHVVLECHAINYNQIASTIDTQIRSMETEENSYQIVLPMLVHAFNIANNGFCHSIDELEKVNPEKPYWRGDIYTATTIGNKNYFISGDINTSVYGSSWTTFFNEEIVKSYNIENPYEIVKDGDWTLEKMLTLSKDFGGDNGDGIFDNNDNYAICSGTWVWQCFLYGSNLKLIDKDIDDIPFLVTEDATKREMLQDVLVQTVEIMNDQTLSINSNKAGISSQPSQLFCRGQVLFYFANVNNAFVENDIKDMSQEYGMLPLPKRNDSQDYYSNAVHPHHSSTVIVPSNIPTESLGLISSVLEDLAYYSYEYVKPAYYDTVITYRSVRNEDSFEMMPYIFEHFDIDFGLIMTDTFGFDTEFRNKILNNDVNFSSYLTSYTSLWKIALENVVKTYGGEKK